MKGIHFSITIFNEVLYLNETSGNQESFVAFVNKISRHRIGLAKPILFIKVNNVTSNNYMWARYKLVNIITMKFPVFKSKKLRHFCSDLFSTTESPWSFIEMTGNKGRWERNYQVKAQITFNVTLAVCDFVLSFKRRIFFLFTSAVYFWHKESLICSLYCVHTVASMVWSRGWLVRCWV